MEVEERRRDLLEPRLEVDSQHSWSRERLDALCLSLLCRASPACRQMGEYAGGPS